MGLVILRSQQSHFCLQHAYEKVQKKCLSGRLCYHNHPVSSTHHNRSAISIMLCLDNINVVKGMAKNCPFYLSFVVVYYVTPSFDNDTNGDDMTRAQTHLKEIVKYNQLKHQLSFSVEEDM